MKKILLILSLVAAGLVSCEMDHYRSDTMTSTQLKDDPGAAVYTTDGNYSLFKDVLEGLLILRNISLFTSTVRRMRFLS